MTLTVDEPKTGSLTCAVLSRDFIKLDFLECNFEIKYLEAADDWQAEPGRTDL